MTPNQTALIVSDSPQMLDALATFCSDHGLTVTTADNTITGTTKTRKDPPNLLIVDIGLAEDEAFKMCQRIRELRIALPVIFMTTRSDAETISQCEALDTHHFQKEDAIWEKLEALIEKLLQSSSSVEPVSSPVASVEDIPASRQTPKVLAIDDDPNITKAIKVRLRYHGLETIEASNGMVGYMLALKERPDVIISDYSMPQGSGDHLLARLSQNPITSRIPVIILTGKSVSGGTDIALKRHMLGYHGATAFLEKPLDFEKLQAELGRHINLVPIKTIDAIAS